MADAQCAGYSQWIGAGATYYRPVSVATSVSKAQTQWVTFLKGGGPSPPTACPAFNTTNKEMAKSCVIDCVLPKVVPALTKELGLAPPLDMLAFFHGPDHTNKTAMPGLHPNCNGYKAMGGYIAKKVFGVDSEVGCPGPGASCTANKECCSNKCAVTSRGNGMCK